MEPNRETMGSASKSFLRLESQNHPLQRVVVLLKARPRTVITASPKSIYLLLLPRTTTPQIAVPTVSIIFSSISLFFPDSQLHP